MAIFALWALVQAVPISTFPVMRGLAGIPVFPEETCCLTKSFAVDMKCKYALAVSDSITTKLLK